MTSKLLRLPTLALTVWGLIQSVAWGATPASYTFLTDSTVAYHVTHPMHRTNAESHQVLGAVRVEPGDTPKLVMPLYLSIPLTSFRSGNRNRDRNMLVTLNAAQYPNATILFDQVTWKSLQHQGTQYAAEGLAKGRLSLHGVTRPIEVPLKGRLSNEGLSVESHFSFRCTDFGIERPSLLFQPIDDRVAIDVTGVARR